MKAVKSNRQSEDHLGGDSLRRGTKLTPNKKSGKERHHLYQSLEVDEEDDDEYFTQERESILDYLDDDDDLDNEEEDDD